MPFRNDWKFMWPEINDVLTDETNDSAVVEIAFRLATHFTGMEKREKFNGTSSVHDDNNEIFVKVKSLHFSPRFYLTCQRVWLIGLILSTPNELIIQLRDAVRMLKLTRNWWHWFHLQHEVYMNNSSVSADSIIMCLCHFKQVLVHCKLTRHNCSPMWPGYKCARPLNRSPTHNIIAARSERFNLKTKN